jgi:hypothetical protein
MGSPVPWAPAVGPPPGGLDRVQACRTLESPCFFIWPDAWDRGDGPGPLRTDPARCCCAHDRPDRSPRPAKAGTCGMVASPSCPYPSGWPRRGVVVPPRRRGGRSGAGLRPYDPTPGLAQLNLPSQGCSSFSGGSSGGVCSALAGDREIAENRHDPPARTRRTRRTPPRPPGPVGVRRATPTCPAV